MKKIEEISKLLADLGIPYRRIGDNEVAMPTGTLMFQDPTKSYYGLDGKMLSNSLLVDMSAEDCCLHFLEEDGKIYWIVALNESWEDGGSKIIL